jgi:hypothetical protein
MCCGSGVDDPPDLLKFATQAACHLEGGRRRRAFRTEFSDSLNGLTGSDARSFLMNPWP